MASNFNFVLFFSTLFVQKNYNILVLDIAGQEIQFNKKLTHLPRFQIYASQFPLQLHYSF